MFKGVHNALEWAYEVNEEAIVEQSSINRMREEPSGMPPNSLTNGFSVQERHLQAAQILGMVNRLADPAGREYIGGEFGNRTEPAQLRMLTYRCCDALGLGLDEAVHVCRMLRLFFFAGNLPYRTVRMILRCRDQHALMTRRCLYDVLDLTRRRAMADLHEDFERHGLIRSVAWGQ